MVIPAYAQYAGPAILSRGEAPGVISLPELRFTPWVGIAATYDTGLSAVTVSDTGQLANASSYGATVSWGISGTHSWKNHTQLGLAYSGAFNWYDRNIAHNMSHNLMIGVSHDFSRRVRLEWRQTAGMTTRNYAVAGLVETVPFDPSSTYIPTTDFFDNRDVYVQSSLGLTYALSKRLSIRMSGAAFADNRQSHALTNSWGTQESGDVQYRLSAHTTLGGGYNYMHFGYAHYAGGTDAHVVQGSYSVRLSRRVEFSAYAGAMRIESKYLQSIPIDPTIQALLGISQGVQIGHFIETTPTASGRLARSFQRGVAYVSAGRTVMPGNGLFLTSISTTVTAGYGYTGFRHWSLSAQGGYVKATAEGAIAGRYGNWTAGITAGRQITRRIGWNASATMRKYSSADYSLYNRWITTVNMGLHYSPGEMRLPGL
jgi:hypothetical protein